MDDLFTQQESEFEFIGSGLALKKISDPNTIQLYKNGIFVKSQVIVPQIEKRLFVVDLVDRQGATKSKLAKVLNISRQSIDNWIEISHKYGSTGLINNTKESWKKNPKRFTGNKARDLEARRKEEQQALASRELTINFDADVEVDENHCGAAQTLYNQEFDYQENRYSGSMLYIAILITQFNIFGQLSSLIDKYLWIPFMFVLMHVNKILSVEQFKTAYRREFGQIMGLKTLPHIAKIRESIWELTNSKKGLSVANRFFKLQIIKGIVSVWRLFLDGHMVPYSGKEKVHKAHSTQRDMMMAGQTEFFAHDSFDKGLSICYMGKKL